MSKLVFQIHKHRFQELPLFERFRAAWADDGLKGDKSPGFCSASPFLRAGEVAGLLADNNPDLPRPSDRDRYVVTGQQPGLMTGPLYTFLKAVSVITLAERATSAGGGTVRSLFWIASEDHDVNEVNRFTLNGRRFVHAYGGPLARGQVPPVGEISLAEAREPLLVFLREQLPETEFSQALLEEVASTDFANYDSAFAGLLRFIFRGASLYLISPSLLQPLTAPILARLVEQWPEVLRAFEEGTSSLRARGLEPPLQRVGLFEIVDGKRLPVEFTEKSVTLGGETLSFTEGAAVIRSRGRGFSPGAALRPIVQDGALPVRAFVAGPTEGLYLQQIQPLYEIAGVRPAAVVPRISATFIEGKVRRAAVKAALPLERIFQAGQKAEAEAPAAELPPALAKVESLGRQLLEAVTSASPEPEPRWLKKNTAGLRNQVERLVERLRDEGNEAFLQDRERLKKVAAALYPANKPQERVGNLFQFLNLYGPEFIDRALESLDPLATEHQAVFLDVVNDPEEKE